MGFGIWVFESLWVLAFEFLWVLDFGEKEKKMGRGVEEEGEMTISVGFQQCWVSTMEEGGGRRKKKWLCWVFVFQVVVYGLSPFK